MKKIVILLLPLSILLFIMIRFDRIKNGEYSAKSTSLYVENENLENGKMIFLDNRGNLVIDNDGTKVKITHIRQDGKNRKGVITAYCISKEYVYYVYMFDSAGYEVYKYNTNTNKSNKLYETKDCNQHIYGISTNGKCLLLVFDTHIDLVDLKTLVKKKLIDINDNSKISIYKEKVFISDISKQLKYIDITTKTTKTINDVYANDFFVWNNSIYYCDMKNGGKLTVYDLSENKKHKFDSDSVIGFTQKDGSIFADFYDGEMEILKF